MVNFMCQLCWALVPRYLVKHYSGMCLRRTLRDKSVDLWVGLIQLVERPKEFCHQTETASLSRVPSHCATLPILGLHLHNRVSQFLKTNLSLTLFIMFLWRTLNHTEGCNSGYSWDCNQEPVSSSEPMLEALPTAQYPQQAD